MGRPSLNDRRSLPRAFLWLTEPARRELPNFQLAAVIETLPPSNLRRKHLEFHQLDNIRASRRHGEISIIRPYEETGRDVRIASKRRRVESAAGGS